MTAASPPESHLSDNFELLQALARYRQRPDDETRYHLFRALLSSQVFVPVPSDAASKTPSGPAVLVGGSRIAFVTGRGTSGVRAVLAFSTLDAFRIWDRGGSSYVVLWARDLFRLALHNDFHAVLLDPPSSPQVEITTREMGMLADGVLPIAADADGRLSAGQLPRVDSITVETPAAPVAEDLVIRLREIVSRHDAVREAFLFEVRIGSGPPHLAIGISFIAQPDDREVKSLIEEATRRQAQELEGLGYVDFLLLDKELHQAVRRKVKPFFTRA